MSNGNRIAITYPEAVHYEENGEWKEIDNTLIYESALTPEDLIGYATQAGSVKYKFAENGEAEALVRLTMEDYSVLFSLAEEQAGEALLPDISEDTEESGAETSSEIPVQAEQPEMTEVQRTQSQPLRIGFRNPQRRRKPVLSRRMAKSPVR